MLSRKPLETSPRLRGLVLLLLICCFPGARAGTAAVAMPDSYSTEVAQDVIDAGGNAVDAAVAAAFVLAVTYPEAGNIGGGGFMLSYMGGEAAFLDFRERAPLAATRDMYLDEAGNFIQDKALTGGKPTSATAPCPGHS